MLSIADEDSEVDVLKKATLERMAMDYRLRSDECSSWRNL
jgi:hypothetical protein